MLGHGSLGAATRHSPGHHFIRFIRTWVPAWEHDDSPVAPRPPESTRGSPNSIQGLRVREPAAAQAGSADNGVSRSDAFEEGAIRAAATSVMGNL